MKALNEEQLEALQKATPQFELEVVEDVPTELFVVVRPPNGPEWRTYRSESSEPTMRYVAMKKLVTLVAMYPTGTDLAAHFDRYPAAVEVVLGKVAEMAGISDTATRRKLSKG